MPVDFTWLLLSDRVLNLLPLQSRFDILKIHSRKMNLMRGIDLKKIAEKMNGASGAELKVCQLHFI
jgi:ATP-dependent 26S proteasome regulatory subunit